MVRTVGYPGSQGPVVSQGRLRGIWHFGNSSLLQSATLAPCRGAAEAGYSTRKVGYWG